jgi:hypothetical protein
VFSFLVDGIKNGYIIAYIINTLFYNGTQMVFDRKRGLEKSSELQGVGRDPRDMSPDDLRALGHNPVPLLKAIRARCVDCCGDVIQEVRLCPAVACPSWPFRMGTNPWRKPRTLTDEARAAFAERMKSTRG